MTTRQFIERNFGVESNKDRKCSSVWADNKGNIYSYGQHYPLLFKAKGLIFRNCAGYSSSTAKHINWAGGFGAIDVWVSGCNMYTYNNPENANKVPAILRNLRYYQDSDASNYKAEDRLISAVFADLEAELVDINNRLSTKTRTNTKVYADLIAERNDCVDRIASVRPYLAS